jgi:uncharacterized DUF497 family protein
MIVSVDREWDAAKAAMNLRKRGVWFADAVSALEDATATTIRDPDSAGCWWSCIGGEAAGCG